MLQTFPDNYELTTDHIDAVCELIGNAVPPRYAESAGKAILTAIKSVSTLERSRR